MEERDVLINEQDELIDDTPLLGQITFEEILAEIRYWLHDNIQTRWPTHENAPAIMRDEIWLTPDAQQWLSIRR